MTDPTDIIITENITNQDIVDYTISWNAHCGVKFYKFFYEYGAGLCCYEMLNSTVTSYSVKNGNEEKIYIKITAYMHQGGETVFLPGI